MRPQCSACFINSVGDTLESILDLAKTEGMLFKWGSGTGTNLSTLREEDGLLSSGGRASGPLSFMKGFDAFAGVIKSGGKTRRAAKMVILNADHPDIEAVYLVQGQGREESAHADRRRLRFVARRRRVCVHLFPERQQQRARHRRVHASRGERRRMVDHDAAQRRKARPLSGSRADEADRRGDPPVRRSRHAVRHDHQQVAHVEEHGADQRVESVLGIHVPGRFGVQSGVAEPDEVRGRRTASSTSKRTATRWIP